MRSCANELEDGSGKWEDIEQKRHAEPCPRHAELASASPKEPMRC